MQSLKRNEGRLVDLANPPPVPTPRPTPAPSDYNAYAELKGRSKPRE